MSKKVDPAVREAAKAMGAKGGKNGTGASKKRPDAHYRRLSAIRQANRLKRISEQS